MHGNFNFNATPMAPLGTKVMVHSNPSKRASWDLHDEMGWHIGPLLNHYRCVKYFITRTRVVVDADAVEFFLHSIPFPSVTLQDFLVQAASDITSILNKPPNLSMPSLKAGDEVQNAVLTIAKLLKRVDKIPQLKDIENAQLPRV